MPIPRAITRANRRALNPIIRSFAGIIPPFLLLGHVGRSSGKRYSTPLMGFPISNGFVFALTYGPDTDWQLNLEAANGAEAVYRRRTYRLSEPRRVHGDPRDQPLPRIVQYALKVFGVRDFLFVSAQPTEGP